MNYKLSDFLQILIPLSAAAALLALCIVGSGVLDSIHDTADVNVNQKLDSIDDDNIYVWTDTETGVQYIVCYRNRNGCMGGITPRLNADGSIYTDSTSFSTASADEIYSQ